MKNDLYSLLSVMDCEELLNFKIDQNILNGFLVILKQSNDRYTINLLDTLGKEDVRSPFPPIKLGKLMKFIDTAYDLPFDIEYLGNKYEILTYDKENNLIYLKIID